MKTKLKMSTLTSSLYEFAEQVKQVNFPQPPWTMERVDRSRMGKFRVVRKKPPTMNHDGCVVILPEYLDTLDPELWTQMKLFPRPIVGNRPGPVLVTSWLKS